MAMMDSATWNGQDQAMHNGGEDDFQQFLDMNNMAQLGEGLQFDFQDFPNGEGAPILNQPPRDAMDTAMSGTDQPVIISRPDPVPHNQMPPGSSAPSHPLVPTTMMPPPTPTDAISEIDAQIQFLQQQRLQQQQRQLEEHQAAFFAQQSRMVPPTPQSLEMSAANGQFYGPHPESGHTQQAIYDQYQRIKEQQELSFTPLVSPAVTPLEPTFPIETQFTVPGAYFSPLTSPALHAQNDGAAPYDQRLGAANTSSPGEMDLESGPPAAHAAGGAKDLAKQVRKSNAAKARVKPNVRQSPITKPQRRKTGTTPILNAQALTELAEEQQRSSGKRTIEQVSTGQGNSHSSGAVAMDATDSENASVSPETLSEMPPPPLPKPKSAKPSPQIQPQGKRTPVMAPHQTTSGKPSPATPASLMRLPSPRQGSADGAAAVQGAAAVDQIESLELPESANFPKPRPKSTQNTPKLAAGKAPTPLQLPNEARTPMNGFQALPSPGFAKPIMSASAAQSPQLTPGSASARRTPQLMAKGSKKRGSVSSIQVSPALRPKISPQIKPLLPGGTTAEDTASALLASKSNYQNILEGNKVPGVSYPSELSTNLTSKRTSHKIAEQGRRNRINSALQEIATLLPRSVGGETPRPSGLDSDEGEGNKDGKGGNNLPSSKASTVELAIEYIKQLKKEVEEANLRAEKAEKKLEGMA